MTSAFSDIAAVNFIGKAITKTSNMSVEKNTTSSTVKTSLCNLGYSNVYNKAYIKINKYSQEFQNLITFGTSTSKQWLTTSNNRNVPINISKENGRSFILPDNFTNIL